MKPPEFYPDRIPHKLLWLSGGLLLAVIPHCLRVPLWISSLFFSLVLYRIYSEQAPERSSNLNGRLIRPLIMLVIVAGISLSYGTLVGRDAGVSLLVLLASMKLLEMQNERDFYVVCFIALFLVLTGFFYSQSIIFAVHMIFSVVVIISAMTCINDKELFLSTRARVSFVISLLLQAIPLLFILFVLFPRIDGPLWGLPKDAVSGKSGLSDEMSPGQISQLSLSNEVAFRVKFLDSIPGNAQLYWRGPVFWYSDGVKWVGDKSLESTPEVIRRGDLVKYTVTMEPTDRPWLYALELPNSTPYRSYFSPDLQILTRSPVTSRKRYEISSHLDFTLYSSDQAELDKALQLPRGYHPKAVEYGQSLKNEKLPTSEVIDRILNMFNREEFYYTLQPPLLLNDSVDEFLFDTRKGFCEHYASSFVILMRAAGIPARVVTGYQGGTLNPVGDYLLVRQRDAHAWAEVWMQEDGWVRVDPTAAVSPARIQMGIETALPDALIDIPLGLQNSELARDLWRQVRDRLDALNNNWNQWVLGYNNKRQLRLLNKFGFKNIDWRGLAGGLIILVTFSLAVVAFILFYTNKYKPDPARVLYNRFCKKLVRHKLQPFANEGPLDFALRAGSIRKDLAEEINSITTMYTQCRYNDRSDLLLVLKQKIHSFNPRPSNP